MKLKILLESLRDISTENVLYHGTNLENLFQILETKRLEGKVYSVAAEDKYGLRDEIATARKSIITYSMKTSNKLSDVLSKNITCVLFHLYKDRITSGVRGVKVAPIAELVKDYTNQFKDEVEEAEAEYNKKYLDVLVSFFADCVSKKYTTKVIKQKLKEKLFELFDENANYFNLDYTYTIIKNIYNFTIYREAEERFILNDSKTKGIPVNKNFMKIEFIDNPIDEATTLIESYKNLNMDFYGYGKKNIKKSMLTILNKNEDLFIKNKFYTMFVEWLQK